MNKDQASQRPEFVPIGVDKLARLAKFTKEESKQMLNEAGYLHLFTPSGDHGPLPDFLIEAHYQLIAQHEYLALSEQALFGVNLRIKEIDKILWNDQDKDKNTASLFPSNSQHHLKAMDDEDKETLNYLIARHKEYTGSDVAEEILAGNIPENSHLLVNTHQNELKITQTEQITP